MIDEIYQSIRAQLYERAVSPLMGSFLVSWCLWNYKIILVILSGLTIQEKLSFIDTIHFSNWVLIATYGLLYPLATSVAYIIFYPHPAKYFFEYSSRRQKELSDLKKTIHEESLLSVADSRELNRKIFQLENEYQKELDSKDLEITHLKALVKDSTGSELSNNSVLDQISDSKGSSYELTALQDEMLSLLGHLDGESVGENHFHNELDARPIAIRHALQELLDFNYIAITKNGYYEITHKGRGYVLTYLSP